MYKLDHLTTRKLAICGAPVLPFCGACRRGEVEERRGGEGEVEEWISGGEEEEEEGGEEEKGKWRIEGRWRDSNSESYLTILWRTTHRIFLKYFCLQILKAP